VIFLADESIDRQIVEAVRRDAYEVLSVAETSPGIPDAQVLSRANATGAVLLTADKDIGELVFRQSLAHSGVVLVRLGGCAPEMKALIVTAAISAHVNELEFGFAVVTGNTVRIRRFPR
jgi:predicted nuclease of predicted toxin-antitoxin system